MNGRDDTNQPVAGSVKTAIRVIRGVGAGDKDGSFKCCRDLLAADGVDLANAGEINWSWERFICWPYTGAPRSITLEEDFLRMLARAVRGTIQRSDGRNASQPRVILIASELLPILFLGVVLTFTLGYANAARSLLLLFIALLLLSIGRACISPTKSVALARIRGVLLGAAWPFIFFGALPATSRWAGPFWFATVMLISFVITHKLVPQSWLVSHDTPGGGAYLQ